MKRYGPSRYSGENPHQRQLYKRNWQGSRHGGIKTTTTVRELSYNNIVDMGSCVEYGVGITDPVHVLLNLRIMRCRNGIHIARCVYNEYEADSVSAFGGIVGLNRLRS